MRGIVAAGLLCVALAWATAFRLPVFFGADERTHLGYVVSIVEGRLPEVHDPLPTADDRFPVLARSMDLEQVPAEHRGPMLNVANHPPLFYVVAAPLTRLAAAVGPDTLPPLVVRLLNGAFMGVGVVMTGLLARRLLPTVPRAGVVAAGVAAVTPNVVGVAAYGHNDGIAFALGAGALLVAVRLLQDGPVPRLVAAGAAVAVACALTRASLLVAAAVVAGAAVLGGLRHRPGGSGRLGRHGPRHSRRDRPGRARGRHAPPGPPWPAWWPWAAGGIVGASVAVLAGWFYLRNQSLYGSPTADGVLLDAFLREPRGTVLDVLRAGWFHAEMWTKLYGSIHPELFSPYRWWVVGLLVAVGVAGAVKWAAAARRGEDRSPGIGPAGWGLLAAYTVGVVVSVADFVSKGGSMHPRYFFALVPLTSVLLTAALGALPLRRALGPAAVAGLLAVMLSQLARYEDLIARRDRIDTLLMNDRPAGPVLHWMALAVAVAAFGVLVVELVRTRTGAGEVTSRPSPAPVTPTESRSAAGALDGAA